jgi:acetyl-CoA carboxylase carboxyl transferase subunit alpha
VALAAGNRVLMLEHAVYAVISPEGCASILWRDAARAADAAAAMRITAPDLLALGVIDGIIPEPVGGAQRAPHTAIAAIGDAVAAQLAELDQTEGAQCKAARRRRFLAFAGVQ